MRRLLWLALAVVSITAGAGGSAQADSPITYGKPGSVWRTPIPRAARTDPRSADAVSELVTETKQSGGTAYVNTLAYSGPIMRATPHTPRVPVYVGLADGSQPTYDLVPQHVFVSGPPAAMTGVPDPYAVGWQPPQPGDSDQQYAAYCADCVSPDGTRHGYAWELWRFNRCDPATKLGAAGIAAGYEWCARWGGRDAGVAESPGYPTTDWEGFPYPSGPDPFIQTTRAAKYEDKGMLTTATSLPLTAGEITAADVRAGAVKHALGAAVIYAIRGHVWPAQRDDGWAGARGVVQEGMHFQLDPAIHCGTFSRPITRILCTALEHYGLIIWDKAGAFSLRAEPAVRQEPHWGGVTGSQALAGIPWSRLRLLTPGTAADPYP